LMKTLIDFSSLKSQNWRLNLIINKYFIENKNIFNRIEKKKNKSKDFSAG
jgi:hypothetical protein